MKKDKKIYPAYPNQADPSYYTQKLLDIAAGIASGVGLFISILFLATLM